LHAPVDNFARRDYPSATLPIMRIICPVCGIWLVDLTMTGGEGSFWCLGCSEAADVQVEDKSRRLSDCPAVLGASMSMEIKSVRPLFYSLGKVRVSSIEGNGAQVIQWLKRLFGFDGSTYQPPATTPRSTVASQMDQGDYHSGPHGYSPNTAYPGTEYGSRFSEEAEWAEDQ
jgi:hypothetical protein